MQEEVSLSTLCFRCSGYRTDCITVAVVFLGQQKGGGEDLALKKMDTSQLDSEDIQLVRDLFCHVGRNRRLFVTSGVERDRVPPGHEAR